ncbi:hypothetical protein OXPF_12750 [Oxobacter pfennigii]|uniref:Uncharacterized protein n=1 Tax=Oxobacter pfennigii TaxID=36849 RepID=A0A0P8YZ77_9CLOT|nr:hypothetical protein [Oxobacter pfennigii]KPU45148.1 hypothetical protein OXPF_12750 [Oxobacter pfennigii]
MKDVNNKSMLTIIRINIILAAGVLISLAFFSGQNVYSWFSSAASANMDVQVGTADSIIAVINMETINPDKIRLAKSAEITDSPLIFFSVEGEAAQYVSPLNPVRIADSIEVPIKVRVTLRQYLELLQNEEDFTGEIKVKYLNEFIDEGLAFTFKGDFLKASFIEALENEENITGDSSLNDELTELLLYIVRYGIWDEDIVDNIAAGLGVNEKFSEDMFEFSFSKEQLRLLKALTPGLIEYVDRLYDTAQELDHENESMGIEIADKENKIFELEAVIISLEDEVNSLKEQNAGLDLDNREKLPETIDTTEETNTEVENSGQQDIENSVQNDENSSHETEDAENGDDNAEAGTDGVENGQNSGNNQDDPIGNAEDALKGGQENNQVEHNGAGVTGEENQNSNPINDPIEQPVNDEEVDGNNENRQNSRNN